MSNLLDQIVATKKREVDELLGSGILSTLQNTFKPIANPDPDGFGFAKAIKRNSGEKIKVITECKKASPSLGLLREKYDALQIANLYKQAGASAISVLTDKNYFQGSLSDLEQVSACGLPVIRKDFIIDPIQIYMAKGAGASAILLIVRLLSQVELESLYNLALVLKLDVLVEIHNEEEMMRALDLKAQIIGINHRNLDTLEMDLGLSSRLAPIIRKTCEKVIIVAESGVENLQGIKKVDSYCDAILIGSALMASDDILAKYRSLFG